MSNQVMAKPKIVTSIFKCRHFKPGSVAVWCMNKTCSYVYCDRCLINRYDEKVEEIDCLEKWSCPKCRGICNCSTCMKRRGREPTGNLTAKRQSPGLLHVFNTPTERRKITPNKAIAPDKVARYGEKAEEIVNSEKWSCPRCREICNCCICIEQTKG